MELLLIKKPLNKVEVITSKLLWSPWICPVCHNQDPVILSSYMTSWKITCHWFIIEKKRRYQDMCSMTGAIGGARAAHASGATCTRQRFLVGIMLLSL
jgi:hypothetical protein